MKLKNKEKILVSGALLGLGVVGFLANYMKARKVDNKVDSLGDHVNTSFNEFEDFHNRYIEAQGEIYGNISFELFDIKEEICTCYEHIEELSKKLDKTEDKVEV